MKKLVLLFSVAALFAACNDAKKEDAKPAEATAATAAAKAAPSLPFNATYSSSFEMGSNRAYEAMIEQGSWKDWQDNKMTNMKSWVADTIVALQSNNIMVKGVDSLQATWNRNRAYYTSVIDTVDAVMSVYSTDKKENWVLVWAKEISTDIKGKTDTASIMETWRINKDGKADFLLQYDRATRKK